MDLFTIFIALGFFWVVAVYWLAGNYYLYYQQGDLRDVMFIPVDFIWEPAEQLPTLMQYAMQLILFVLAPVIVPVFWLIACAIIIAFVLLAWLVMLIKFVLRGFRPITA